MSVQKATVTVPHLNPHIGRRRRSRLLHEIADAIGRVIAHQQIPGDHRSAADEAYKYVFSDRRRTDAFVNWFEKDGGR